MSDLKIQGEVVMDASGATAALDKVGASAGDMANKVTQAAGKAGEAVDGIGAGAEAGAEKFTRAEARMRDAIKKSTEQLQLLGKTASQQLEFKIETKGLDAEKFQSYLAELRQLELAQKSVGVSAAQTAAAMRGVPAQFTDIITSLQGGQAPLTVFLQQGGQLKDMFGGAGAAAKALGGYVVGLITPLNLGAAALIGIGVAAYAGSKEMEAWRSAVIQSGNAAGASVQQFQAMADSMDSVSGITKGSASEALTIFASTGKVASGNLEQFSVAAIKYSKETGQGIDDLAKQFGELSKDPLAATLKLNEGMNFLTMSVYSQIKALTDQGKTVEAADLAQKTFADTLAGRAGEMEKNIGSIERAWRGVKSAVADAVDAIKGIGRESTFGEKALPLMDQIGSLEKLKAQGLFWNDLREQALQKAKKELSVLEDQYNANQKNAQADAARKVQVEARAQADKDGLKYLSEQQKMLAEITQQTETLKRAGATPDEIAKRIADIKASYEKKATGKEANPFASSQEAAKEWAKYVLEAAKAAAEAEAATDGLTKSQAKLIEYLQSTGYQNASEEMRQFALQQFYAAIAAEKHGAAEKVAAEQAKEAAKAMNEAYDGIVKRTDALKSEAEKQQASNEQIGLGKVAIAALEAARLDEMATAKDRRADLADDIDWSKKMGDAYREEAKALRALANLKRDGAFKQDMIDTAKETAAEWKKTAENIERTITDSLMRGFESGKSFAANFRDTLINMFKTLVLRPIINFIINPIAGAITNMLQSSGLSSLSGIVGLTSTATAATNASTAAAITGDAASAAAAASAAQAAGASSAMATAASYVPYVAAAYAAYKILGSLDGGETRTGGQYAVAYDGKVVNNRRGETYYYDDQYFQRPGTQKNKVQNGTAYRIEADGMGTQEDAIRTAVSSTATNIQEMLKALGSTATLNGFWAGLETSGNGRGGVFSGGSFANGTKFGESGKGDNYSGTLYELTSTRSPDAATAMANFTLDLKQVTIQALQAASDIPQTIKDKLKDVDAEALTSDAADTLLTWITDQIKNVNSLATLANSLPLQNLKNLSFDAASGLIELAGGIDTLSSQIDAYYKNYYTAEEQRAATLGNITKALGTVGITDMPKTLADYRKLVDSQDLSTEAGRKTYTMLMALADAFYGVTKSSEDAAAAAKKEAETKAQAEKDAAQAAKDKAIAAANTAYAALEQAISAQKTLLQAQAQAAQATISTISSIMDTLKSNIDELYNSVATTQIQNQRQALEFIDQSLATAQAGGALPDGTKLADAISAARSGMADSSGYSSLFEQQRAQLILAGKLSQLQDIAGVQKSLAQQQLDAANEQIDQLDKTLAYWKEATAIATGTWKATLSVVDAINSLRDANAAATAATTTKPGVVQTGASPDFAVGGGGSGSGAAVVKDPKSLREIYKAAYGWSDDDFKSWYANPLNTANAEEEAKRRGIPVMAVGTNYLPRDGYIYAHQGEAIVPRAYNPAANGVLQSDGQTARLLTSLIEEVRAMRASTERTASAVEGNQSVPLLVEIAS